MTKKLTYKSSGVDIDKANVFIKKIKPLVKGTSREGTLSSIGGFGGLFALAKGKYRNPVLTSSTDGVGTKLKIAQELNMHKTVGIDLVAMNVNDMLCLGAKPLFFLDYIACGKLNPKVLTDVVEGIADGCKQSGCALIGGETAEMPGMYSKEEYDLAGFSVGVIEKSKIIDGSKIKPGDKIIGIQSSGLHSNGFSLVRKALSKNEIKKHAKEILKPTRIYVKPVLNLISKFNIKGIAHVTGGAYYEKIPKVLPKGLSLRIVSGSWPVPKIFELIQKKGRISQKEMFRTFNVGIGMVLIVRPKDETDIIKNLAKNRLKSWTIGEIVKGNKKTEII